MSRIRSVYPVLAAGFWALLGGCAQLEWHKADTTAAVRDRDAAECTAQARSEALRRMPLLQPPGPRIVVDNEGRALAIQPSGSSDERFLIEHDLARACMRERGYVLRSPPAPAP
jgi:hypothetical protein